MQNITLIDIYNVMINGFADLKAEIIRLDKKIDAVEERLNKRIDEVEEKLNAVEEKLNNKIDTVEEKLTKCIKEEIKETEDAVIVYLEDNYEKKKLA